MAMQVLKKPVITEKSLALAASENTYVFEVDKRATKGQIKNAAESTFKVSVVRVRTIVNQKKNVRTGRKRLQVQKPKIKKALITLRDNDSIDLFDFGGQE